MMVSTPLAEAPADLLTPPSGYTELCAWALTTCQELAACEAAVLCELTAEGTAYVMTQTPGHAAHDREPCAFSSAGRLALWLDPNDTCLGIPDAGGGFVFFRENGKDPSVGFHA